MDTSDKNNSGQKYFFENGDAISIQNMIHNEQERYVFEDEEEEESKQESGPKTNRKRKQREIASLQDSENLPVLRHEAYDDSIWDLTLFSTRNVSPIRKLVQPLTKQTKYIQIQAREKEMAIVARENSFRYELGLRKNAFFFWDVKKEVEANMPLANFLNSLVSADRYDSLSIGIFSKKEKKEGEQVMSFTITENRSKKNFGKRQVNIDCVLPDYVRPVKDFPIEKYQNSMKIPMQSFVDTIGHLNKQNNLAIFATNFRVISISSHTSLEGRESSDSLMYQIVPNETTGPEATTKEDRFCRLFVLDQLMPLCNLKSLSEELEIYAPTSSQKLPLIFLIRLTQVCTCQECVREAAAERLAKKDPHAPKPTTNIRQEHYNYGYIKITHMHLLPHEEDAFHLLEEEIFLDMQNPTKSDQSLFTMKVSSIFKPPQTNTPKAEVNHGKEEEEDLYEDQ